MRGFSVTILLVALVLPSGHAHASPPSDISTADLQTQATQGVAKAQTNLGLLYFYGLGVPKDYTKAREWFEKAAVQGDAEAQYNLGLLYDFEKGVPQDFATARHWYEQAAMQGHAGAQNNLGGLYEFGHGVKQDSVRAYMWYNVAAALSTNDPQKDLAAENRDEIAGDMTSEQISEAIRLTSQCQTRQFKGC
ncbi:MAG: tetratricopeptide repeat protein [Nitrospirota bacterium]|nr:tetratricopeptide repeat protein [Nitrospirota bacterium]